MVYCPKCGMKNEEDAKFCVKCGGALYQEKPKEKREEYTCFGPREKRVEEECFGIPHGGAIAGIIVGIFVIIIGLAIALELDVGRWLPSFVLITIGILVVVGAIIGLRRMSRR